MSDNEASAWRILGKRWTLPILKIVGSNQAVRFNEIKKALAGISSTMLCERLLELEREGLLAKNLCGSKIEYSLTSSARELEFILIKLDRWRNRHGRAYLVYASRTDDGKLTTSVCDRTVLLSDAQADSAGSTVLSTGPYCRV